MISSDALEILNFAYDEASQMSGEKTDKDYEINREEHLFLRSVLNDLAIVQILRELVKMKGAEEGVEFIQSLRTEAAKFNSVLNSEDTPQDRAWREEFTALSDVLYNGALQSDPLDIV